MCGSSLQEAIFQLQKRDMETGTRAVVEEAAQLLADGREIEAGALVEKAEAMLASGFHPESNGGVKTNGTGQSQAPEEDAVLTRIADKLTQTVSQALVAAFRDVRQHLTTEMHDLRMPVEERLGKLEQANVERQGEIANLATRQDSHEERLAGFDAALSDITAGIAPALARLDRHTEVLRSLCQHQTQRVTVLDQVLEAVVRLKEAPTVNAALADNL